MAVDPNELDFSTVTRIDKPSEPRQTFVPGLTLLAHPDARRVGERAALPHLSSGGKVLLSRREPLFASPSGGPVRPLADAHLSRKPLTIEPALEGDALVIEKGDGGHLLMVEGAEVRQRRRLDFSALNQGVTLLLSERILLLLHWLDPRPAGEGHGLGLVGESPAITRLRRQILQVADHPSPVLLLGETGTGKELAARAIHDAGSRREGPYICVDMGAIPPSLAAAELFGAAAGALGGAARARVGCLRQAAGGTLFLDEVTSAPPEVQALLLRAVESRQVRPVGSDEVVQVDVRMIAATDAEPEQAIAEGRLLAQLRHRLAGHELRLPTLRERREDLGRLLYHFLGEELEAAGELHLLDPVGPRQRAWLEAAAVDRLTRYDWPGNVRQLRNVAGQLVISGRGGSGAEPDQLLDVLLRDRAPAKPPSWFTQSEMPPAARQPDTSDEDFLTRVRQVIDENLGDEDFNVDTLAARLAMSRSSLYLRLEDLTKHKPAQLLLERRLERAARLLSQSQLSVSEIAFQVGFRSISHFSQRFRELRGATPSAYRHRA